MDDNADKRMSQLIPKTLAEALAVSGALPGFHANGNFSILLSEILSGLTSGSTVKANALDTVPGTLYEKISVGAGLSAEIVKNPQSESKTDFILRITRDDDGEIVMTPAVPFDEVLCDTEVNASNVPDGQYLDVRFAPIKFPSGSVESISFSPVQGSSYSNNRVSIAVFGNDSKTLNGATAWLKVTNATLGEAGTITLNNPVEIVRKKYYWAFVAIQGQGRYLGKTVNGVVPANGDTAVSGVISNGLQDGTEDWPDSMAGTTHNNGPFPFIQFNIVR